MLAKGTVGSCLYVALWPSCCPVQRLDTGMLPPSVHDFIVAGPYLQLSHMVELSSNFSPVTIGHTLALDGWFSVPSVPYPQCPLALVAIEKILTLCGHSPVIILCDDHLCESSPCPSSSSFPLHYPPRSSTPPSSLLCLLSPFLCLLLSRSTPTHLSSSFHLVLVSPEDQDRILCICVSGALGRPVSPVLSELLAWSPGS